MIDANELAAAKSRFLAVRAQIDAACERVGRKSDEVLLVGACKRQPIERIAAAVCAGLSQLGENYVQEAQRTRPAVEALLDQQPDSDQIARPRWRMIGNLQRNKAKQAIQIFHAVDSVDRVELAQELDRRIANRDLPALEVSLQVNLSGEPQKSGVSEEELPALLDACGPLSHLEVTGLMAVPAASPSPEARRDSFARLRRLRDTLSQQPAGHSLRWLNMGMSADLEIAIEEGANIVRVGTALFGTRESADARKTG